MNKFFLCPQNLANTFRNSKIHAASSKDVVAEDLSWSSKP